MPPAYCHCLNRNIGVDPCEQAEILAVEVEPERFEVRRGIGLPAVIYPNVPIKIPDPHLLLQISAHQDRALVRALRHLGPYSGFLVMTQESGAHRVGAVVLLDRKQARYVLCRPPGVENVERCWRVRANIGTFELRHRSQQIGPAFFLRILLVLSDRSPRRGCCAGRKKRAC